MSGRAREIGSSPKKETPGLRQHQSCGARAIQHQRHTTRTILRIGRIGPILNKPHSLAPPDEKSPGKARAPKKARLACTSPSGYSRNAALLFRYPLSFRAQLGSRPNRLQRRRFLMFSPLPFRATSRLRPWSGTHERRRIVDSHDRFPSSAPSQKRAASSQRKRDAI